jgi:hypothetical protein
MVTGLPLKSTVSPALASKPPSTVTVISVPSAPEPERGVIEMTPRERRGPGLFRGRRLGHDLGQKHRLEHQPGQFRVRPRTVPPAGLEPATGGLENRCSILLSYGGLDRHLSDEAQA